MNKVYNLRQDTFIEHDQQLTDMKIYNQSNKRTNEMLNGFIFFIGVAGFIAAFMLPKDLVYNRSSLENSFSNSSQLASSSLPKMEVSKNANTLDLGSRFAIDGFFEANEVLSFKFDGFQNNGEVVYTINFGNGEKKEIKDEITPYQYYSSGNYLVKVTAKYGDDEKEIFKENIYIDEAIMVNSEAFVEQN